MLDSAPTGPKARGQRRSPDGIAGVGFGAGVPAERLFLDFPSAVTLAHLADDRVIADSELATALLECRSPQVGGRLSRRWTARRDFETFMARLLPSARIDGVEARLQKNDGTQFWCRVSARLIQAEGRTLILLHMLDLTDQIAARAEISRQRDALHSAEKLSALGQLLGGISHELNNPLSVLSGQALLLKEKAPDSATAERADRILRAAQRCSRIVRSFLDLARGEPAAPVPVDLNTIVLEAIETTIDTLRGAGVEPLLELPRGLPKVAGDPDQLRQVVINLIANARQAMSGAAGPQRISIRTRLDAAANRVVLKVSDTGPGVSADITSRIFDPLFTTKAPGEGTGLGLTLCRQIMEAHGGAIDLEGTSAGGSTFVLSFARLERPAESNPVVRREPSHRKGLSFLILDDRQESGVALADMLSEGGHGLELVQSAFVGARLLRRQRYDAIFCRAGLGDLGVASGLRAIDEARPGAAASVVFILHAEADPAALDALDQLERPYLKEPFDRREISEILELLTLRRAA